LIRNPFRNDRNPTCGFYYNEKGVLKLHDFATEEFYSAIDIVKKLFGVNYYKAIDKILADSDKFGDVEHVEQVREEIEWEAGDPSHLSYFDRYRVIDINTLIKYKVFVARLIHTNSYVLAKGHKNNPLFVFIENERIKWYKPLSKDKTKKWGGTTNSKTLFGYSQLPKKGKILFVTSSLKDVMVLRGLGYNAIALNGEGYASNEDSLSAKEFKKKLTYLEKKFEHIIFYMNNDEAGIKFNIQLARTYHKQYIMNPAKTPKDISDYIEKYNVRRTKQMLQKQISHLLNTNRYGNKHSSTVVLPY
jgi:hypothetical protein